MAMEKFHYTLTYYEDDSDDAEKLKHKIVLPKFSALPFGMVRKRRHMSEAEFVFGLLEELLPEKDIELLDKCSNGDVGKMLNAWQKDSGVTAGES